MHYRSSSPKQHGADVPLGSGEYHACPFKPLPLRAESTPGVVSEPLDPLTPKRPLSIGSCGDRLCPTPYVGTSAKQRHADVRAQLRGPVGASRKVTQKVAIDTNPLTSGPAPDFGGRAYAESALGPAAVQITPDMSGKR